MALESFVTRPAHKDHSLARVDPLAQRVWDTVSHSPLRSLWDFEGTSVKDVWKRTFRALLTDDLFSRAAEMGYYFLFALFPALVCASAILGLAARSAAEVSVKLLHYLTFIVPGSAYTMVIDTFNQTTAASTGGKLTLGLAAALWSASVGFSSMQDGMNAVYKLRESRPYWKARGSAILVTLLLAVLVTTNLAVLLGGDFAARHARAHLSNHSLGVASYVAIRILSWLLALALLMLLFAVIYYFAPDLKSKCWHWLTPGASVGILGWVLASLGFRAYLHYFGNYSVTYGSLGAVIVLLTWFYISGLMLLLGAELNSEIQAAVTEKRLAESGVAVPPPTSTSV